MSSRFPWLEATTRPAFEHRLNATGHRLRVSMKSGEELFATKVRNGVVWFEGGRSARLSKFVWTPLGYQEIASDETDLEKRALEALAIMDHHVQITELDSPLSPLALLSKRLKEEQEAQRRAGTTEFQTLDPLTEKVIVSWMRDLSDPDADIIAERIEGGEHRRQWLLTVSAFVRPTSLFAATAFKMR